MPRKKIGDDMKKPVKPYDPNYYREIGRKGGLALKEKYGSKHFSEMGKKGGNSTKNKHDTDYYSTIGKKGGGIPRLPNQ